MIVPSWLVVWAVLLLLGLVVGVLARFLLTLAVAVVILGLIGIALLGLFAPAMLSELPGIFGGLWNDLPVTSATLFTLGAVVFLIGVLGGVLLTTPLRALSPARSAS